MSCKKKKKKLIMEGFLLILALIYLYPFIIMIFVSLKSSLEAIVSPNTIPTELHFSNYSEAWHIMNYSKVFFNSAIVTGFSLFGIILFAGPAAFMITNNKSKLNKFLYLFFLSGVMVPFYTSLVPMVKIMTALHLNDSLLGLVLSYCGRGMPMAVFLYIGFMRKIPKEVIESAVIDGAGNFTIYWKIIFPMLKSITTTIIILDALWIWNDFLLPLLMLASSKLHTIPLAQYYFSGQYGTRWELAFAAYILSVIPIIILYVLMQRNIIKGISAGAVKG